MLIITQTKATRAPASDSYVKNTLRAAGIRPRVLRSTRLVELVGMVDAKLVAGAYGMTNEAVVAYLADHVAPAGCRTRDSSGATSHTFARTRALSPSTGWPCSLS